MTMNNNNPQHPARTASGPNKYLQLALQTKTPLAIHFNDGEIIPSCIILELDSFSLLIKTVDLTGEQAAGEESVVTRASIKRITSTLEHEHNHSQRVGTTLREGSY
jgi:hypothetical protein